MERTAPLSRFTGVFFFNDKKTIFFTEVQVASMFKSSGQTP
ncbi:hypothetical protein [Bacillus cereus]|nr:hypothetical protein [Bacillus cereus]MCQ6359212.1 hypothetical protein [Bacillus cereus]